MKLGISDLISRFDQPQIANNGLLYSQPIQENNSFDIMGLLGNLINGQAKNIVPESQNAAPSFLSKLQEVLARPEVGAFGAGLLTSQNPNFSGAFGEAAQAFNQARVKEDQFKDFMKQLNAQLMVSKINDYAALQKERDQNALAQEKQKLNILNHLGVNPQNDIINENYSINEYPISDKERVIEAQARRDFGLPPMAEDNQYLAMEESIKPNKRNRTQDVIGKMVEQVTPEQKRHALLLAETNPAEAIKYLEPKVLEWSKPETELDERGNPVKVQYAGENRRVLEGKPFELTKKEERAEVKFEDQIQATDNLASMLVPLERVDELLVEGVKTGGLFDKKKKIASTLQDLGSTLGFEMSNPDLTKAELVDKYIQSAFGKFFASLDKKGLSNMNEREFMNFRDAFMSREMTPEAIREGIRFYKKMKNQADQYIKFKSDWRREFGSLSAMDNEGYDVDEVWRDAMNEADKATKNK